MIIRSTATWFTVVCTVALGLGGCAPPDDAAPTVHTAIAPAVEPGTENEFFVAESSNRLILRPEVVATATPDQGPSSYRLGRGPGGPGGGSGFGVSCTCAGGCAGVCIAEFSGSSATCSGSCNDTVVPGDMCVSTACAWRPGIIGIAPPIFIE